MLRFSLVILLFIAFPFYSISQCAFTIEPLNSAGCMESHSDAVFTDLTNTVATGNTVEKTTGDDNWNGGAFSTASVRNDGYAETRITQTNKTRVFGLSHSNNPSQNGINTVQYAIVLKYDSFWGLLFGPTAEIQESGSSRLDLGSYSIGDRFKIAIVDDIVHYYKNEVLVYKSHTAPSLPLMETTIYGY